MFNSLYIHTDVTCVQIFNNYIFAGVGGFLHIYQLPKGNLIKKKKIFEGQKIYGIKPNSAVTKLIVYGGKRLCLTQFQTQDMEMYTTGNMHVLSDWILDVKWIENDMKLVTAFMHNRVTVWSENMTSEISVKCEERCILYSAHISFDTYQELLIISGTVFSDVLLWKPFITTQNGVSPVLKKLSKHKGVIFSIHCNLETGYICTASDDRSAVLWKITDSNLLSSLSSTNSDTIQINIACQVYGHLSRVFRCLVLKDFFITAGEDAQLILWSFNGALLRKIDTHQGGPIWSLCYDSAMDIICSGGNDGAISTFKACPKINKQMVALPSLESPKIVGILKTGNMVCLSERAVLYYYMNQSSNQWVEIAKHTDLLKYNLLHISPCKKMFALAGFEGQIYLYCEINEALKLLHVYHLKNKSRIFSFHWIDCKTFLVSQKDGQIYLFFIYEHKINHIQTFILPPIKERWPTCVCTMKEHIIIGDRKGNIHNFKLNNKTPINTIKKAHNYLGVTNLYSHYNLITSLGKDGFLKRYRLFNGYLDCIDSNKTKFSWLTALENNCLLSFSGDNFLISDFKFQRVLFETHCGGGHRSWDFLKIYNNANFSFIKQKIIHSIKLDLEHFTPKDIIEGYHVHEINALKVLNINGNHLIISGGEDTILRISNFQNDKIRVLESMKVHLSSIRAIGIYSRPKALDYNNCGEYLLFTAGGRAQIICWHLEVQVNKMEDLKLLCIEKYNFYEPLKHDEPETRIMDLTVLNFEEQIFLFAGSSDGYIKIFLVSNDMSLILHKKILHSHHSITKLIRIYTPTIDLLCSAATDGKLMFWSVPGICVSKKSNNAIYTSKIHQSGITSYSYIINNQNILFLSGGDDNCVRLTSFAISKNDNSVIISKTSYCQDEGIHCAQVTGAYLGDQYFVTSSIDQKIVLCKWTCSEDQVKFKNIGKYDTSIADPQGLETILSENNLHMYVYGNGVEHLQIKFSNIVEL